MKREFGSSSDPTTRSFLRSEAFGSLVLLAAAGAAMVWANGWSASYARVFGHDVRHVTNDWAMTVFFFVIGLEIKREIASGQLRHLRTAALPVIAAAGGMVVPATVFVLVAGGGEAGHAWGVPMATDVAFTLGVLALLGRRSPSGMRVFLLTLAVADDVGAIVVIAVAYSGGVHPTVVAVAVALLLPAGPALDRLEILLHPLSTLLVVPLFALANAGVALDAHALGHAGSSRLTWAVIAGLVVGKPVGIITASWAARRWAGARLPSDVSPRRLAVVTR